MHLAPLRNKTTVTRVQILEIQEFHQIRDFLVKSTAKFVEEAEFDVRSAIAPQKPCQIDQNFFLPNMSNILFPISEQICLTSKDRTSGIV